MKTNLIPKIIQKMVKIVNLYRINFFPLLNSVYNTFGNGDILYGPLRYKCHEHYV